MKRIMSKDNPDGLPLEQLLSEMIEDIEEKQGGLHITLGFNHTPTDRELAELFSDHRKAIMATIYCNNRRVLAGLREALEAQNFTLRALDTLGKDQGPRGTPRI